MRRVIFQKSQAGQYFMLKSALKRSEESQNCQMSINATTPNTQSVFENTGMRWGVPESWSNDRSEYTLLPIDSQTLDKTPKK